MKYLELAQQIIDNNYAAVGVRNVCEDEMYTVGDDCRESYEWDLENDCSTYHTTGATANGTCATHIDTQSFDTNDNAVELASRIAQIIETNKAYGSDNQVIIAGCGLNNDGYFDQGEVRITEAHVIMVVA